MSATFTPVMPGTGAERQVRNLVRSAGRDDINRIIIGLGGQGSRIVNEVRKAIQKAGPEPEGVEFIAMDSDRIALANLDAVAPENQVYLQAPDEKISETMVPWLPREFRPRQGGGCGMQRLTGKAMYLVHRQRIFETINAVVRKMRQRTQMTHFMFVIVTATGGGTGSGMIIDFSIDLRRNMTDLMGQEPMVFGLGILPSRGETIQRANGVAMIKEMHFLLSRKEPLVIGGRDFSNPFELFFIVGREVMGTEKDEELLQSIVRFTIDLGLIPSSSNEGSATGKGAGFVDLQDIRTLIKGSSHMFATFGYYRAEFPADRLREYFDALDKLEAHRARLPDFAKDTEEAHTKVNTGKVDVDAATRKLAEAQARAKRLRASGILGINRPELLRLQEEIGRAEDALRRRKRELAELESAIPRTAEERQKLLAEMVRLERRREELLLELGSPIQTQNTFTFPLTKEQVDFLTANRKLVIDGDFKSVMESIGRLSEYHDKTMEVIGKNKILFMPMLNYRMAFATAALFQPPVLRMLSNFGFVKFDSGGNPIITDDQLWMVMAMLSSAGGNIDPQRLSPRAFKDIVENYIAKRAEVKTLSSNLKRFEVAIHSWMIGLQVAPIAPGYPPRLKELEWLGGEYDKLAREREVMQHHAFLYGDPVAFTEMTNLHIDRMSLVETNDRITTFWVEYAPIDPAARWMQVPPVLAEALVALEGLSNTLGSTARDIDTYVVPTELNAAITSLDQVTGAVRRCHEAALVFQRQAVQDETALKDRLRMLAIQLERTREGPRDQTRFQKLQEITEVTLNEMSSTRRKADDLRDNISAMVSDSLPALRQRLAAAESADRYAAAMNARLRRALTDAETELEKLAQVAAHLPVMLHEIEEVLVRFLTHLRARAGNADRARTFTPTIPSSDDPKTGAPAASAPTDEDVLNRILRSQEGGS